MTVAAVGLSFSYGRGGEMILCDFSHHFRAGAVTAVTGPSGSGKSTLLYLLGLMLTPTCGRVLWDGTPVSGLSDGERSRMRAAHAGFVFQDAMLDPSRSVMSNVCEGGLYAGMSPAGQRKHGLALLQQFGVEHRLSHRPGQVSGGQAQRVALCRALLKRPRLVLGDEPTGNLDRASAKVVWKALNDAAAQGATVVVATHDTALARSADHRVELV